MLQYSITPSNCAVAMAPFSTPPSSALYYLAPRPCTIQYYAVLHCGYTLYCCIVLQRTTLQRYITLLPSRVTLSYYPVLLPALLRFSTTLRSCPVLLHCIARLHCSVASHGAARRFSAEYVIPLVDGILQLQTKLTSALAEQHCGTANSIPC